MRDLQRADLLETHPEPVSSIDLHGYQVATVLARFDATQAATGAADLAPHAEAAQPLYARYWLHNRGPAPLGGLPAVAHLHPPQVSAEPGGEVTLRLTAASDSTDATLHGAVTLRCPDGWTATPAELPFTLRSGDHLHTGVVVAVPAGAEPGLYPVRAELRIAGDGVPAAWRQLVEDVCVVAVGRARRAGLPGRRARRGHARARRSGRRDRHGRQPRRGRPGAGGASDQPVGHLGVDGSRARSARCYPPAAPSK